MGNGYLGFRNDYRAVVRNESNIMKTTIKQVMTLLALAVGAIVSTPHAQAAGLLIADGDFGGVLELKEQDVRVTINNAVAVTKVTQVFHNTEKRQVEAL